jgi:hypothetical protein
VTLVAYSALDALFLTPGAADGPSDRTTSTTSATARAPALPPPNLDNGLIPRKFAGTWRGQFHQAGGPFSWATTITLKAGQSRGTIDVPSLGCSGTFIVVSYLARTRTLTLKPAVTDPSGDDTCFSLKHVKLSLDVVPPRLHLNWPDETKANGSYTGVFTRAG